MRCGGMGLSTPFHCTQQSRYAELPCIAGTLGEDGDLLHAYRVWLPARHPVAWPAVPFGDGC